MRFYSLENPGITAGFQLAVENGIAPGGGLYFPEEIPKLTKSDLKSLAGASPEEIAYRVLSLWIGDEIPEGDLRQLIHQASTFSVPLTQVGDKQILEIYHGPTAAFKDVAACYLAAFMGYFNAKSKQVRTVLVATSGDTGGAIAQGFAGVPRTNVVVLFPRGRVSQLQREQLTRVAKNVISLEIDGTFDDCQDLVKQALRDNDLQKLHLTSANSISIGRLLPQMTYYATSSLAAGGLERKLRYVVPSGNLGNLTAGALARAMGLPINSFLASNNANDMLRRFLESADAQAKPVVATIANAMDVGRPNNLPRLVQVFGGSHSDLTEAVSGATISDKEIIATIKSVWSKHHYLLDPHTASAWAASERHPTTGTTDVIVATAAPQKFAREIEALCHIPVGNASLLNPLRRKPARVKACPAAYSAFRELLHAHHSATQA